MNAIAPEPRVFLDYTQEELDRNFDQRAWVSDADALLRNHAVMSERARQRLRGTFDLRYGPCADETLDFFPADAPGAPLVIFVHGGAWRASSKESHSFVANAYVPAGISVAIPEFGKLPGTAMPDVVEQIRRVIEWAGQSAGSFGCDAGNLHLVGHSSGAHLAATAVTADRSPVTVRSLACISGIYDLIPVMLSARRHYVHLSPQEAVRLSPLRHLQNLTCKTSVFFAEGDSMEFKRQSQIFADSLEAAGKLFSSRRFEANHYDVLDMLDSPESLLSRALRQVALAI